MVRILLEGIIGGTGAYIVLLSQGEEKIETRELFRADDPSEQGLRGRWALSPWAFFVFTFSLSRSAGPRWRELLNLKKGWYIRNAVLIYMS
jgi:hypothetical protein